MRYEFTSLDWAIVLCYLVAVGTVGSLFYRRNTSSPDYFLGGRRMKALPVAISLVAADLSAISYMGVPAWAWQKNLQLFLSTCACLLAAPVVMYLFLPFYSHFKLYTGYQYLERRFDLKTRLVGASLFLLTRGSHVAIVIYVPSIALNVLTGLPLYVCVLMIGVLTTAYTTLGGMRAVIWTDVLQFSVLMLGTGAIIYMSVSRFPEGLVAAYHVASHAGRLSLWNFSLDPHELTSVWAMLFGGTFMILSTWGTDQAYLQRYFTTRSLQEGRRSILMDALIAVPVGLVLYLIGSMLFVYYHYYPGRLRGLSIPDAILPFFVVHELGGAVAGLVIASIFAATMAVMSAGINSLTTVTSIDFYQRIFNPKGTDARVVLVGRLGTIVWGLAATVGALFVGRLGPVVNAFNLINSLLGGPILGMFLLGMLTRRANGRGAVLGGAAGLIVVALLQWKTAISFYYFALVGTFVTFLSGYLISLTGTAPAVEDLQGLVYRLEPTVVPPVATGSGKTE
jgi:solute:Na+ symporter, SSS family